MWQLRIWIRSRSFGIWIMSWVICSGFTNSPVSCNLMVTTDFVYICFYWPVTLCCITDLVRLPFNLLVNHDMPVFDIWFLQVMCYQRHGHKGCNTLVWWKNGLGYTGGLHVLPFCFSQPSLFSGLWFHSSVLVRFALVYSTSRELIESSIMNTMF